MYIQPTVSLSPEATIAFEILCKDILQEFDNPVPDETILQSYLQLFLAKASSIKLKTIGQTEKAQDYQMEAFRKMLEENFLTLHKPADYAAKLAISPNTLTKHCQRYFGKSPSALIQERLLIEAKKKLHLTRQNIKEIAFALNFSDEFYFSRFFKKMTKVSPQLYRKETGISIVADLNL